MALLITDKCTSCDMCAPECPNDAIDFGDFYYEINPDRCTECQGHYDKPTCQSVCPINNCIIIDPDHVETDAQLQAKYKKLHG